MKRADIRELHYIVHIETVPSILERGILSHDLAERVPHISIAMEEIQVRRANKQIPGARTLHEYANLYFDAWNPMLSKVRDRNDQICILRVSPAVLDLPNVIVADRNASSRWARFLTTDVGIAVLDSALLFARDWRHPGDQIEEWRHKSIKCAETLIPDSVAARHIVGVYLANDRALASWNALNTELPASVDRMRFF